MFTMEWQHYLHHCGINEKIIYFLPKKPKSLLIVGGGFQNKFLMKQIEMKIDIDFKQNKNISFDFIEAELMAFLGARAKNKLPITFQQQLVLINQL